MSASIWASDRRGLVVATALTAGAGLAWVLVMPRGPITSSGRPEASLMRRSSSLIQI